MNDLLNLVKDLNLPKDKGKNKVDNPFLGNNYFPLYASPNKKEAEKDINLFFYEWHALK